MPGFRPRIVCLCGSTRFLEAFDAASLSEASHRPDELCISSVTVMEVEYGMEKHPQARRRFGEVWAGLQMDLGILPFDADDARHTAFVQAELGRARTPIGPFDLQLAGTALARRLKVVTHNLAEFRRVAGLECLDWRRG